MNDSCSSYAPLSVPAEADCGVARLRKVCVLCCKRLNRRIRGKKQRICKQWGTQLGTSVHIACKDKIIKDVRRLACGVIEKPLIRFRLNPFGCWRHFSYALIPPDHITEAFAEKVRIELRESDHTIEISGGVSQSTHIPSSSILLEWDGIARSTADGIGFNHMNHHLINAKTLWANPHTGEQPIHWDNPEGLRDRVTIILYLSDTNSTSLPIFHSNLLAGQPTATGAHYLKPELFHHVPVKQGTILFFRQSVPHHGTLNPSCTSPRSVMFSMFSPVDEEADPDQDEYQHYAWQYAEDATVSGSELHEEFLLLNQQFNPSGHYTPSEWLKIQTKMKERKKTKALFPHH